MLEMCWIDLWFFISPNTVNKHKSASVSICSMPEQKKNLLEILYEEGCVLIILAVFMSSFLPPASLMTIVVQYYVFLWVVTDWKCKGLCVKRGRLIDVCIPAAALRVYTQCLFFSVFSGSWSFDPHIDRVSMCIWLCYLTWRWLHV